MSTEFDTESTFATKETLKRFDKEPGYHLKDNIVLVSKIGEGGMANVYRAIVDGSTWKAVKIFAGQTAEKSFEYHARFREAVSILESMKPRNHPGIANIHARGYHHENTPGGRIHFPYYLTDLILGPTLEERGWLAPGDAAEMACQAGDALHWIHTQGHLHRDLKPSNIMQDPTGLYRVIDFSVGRARTRPTERLTESFSREGIRGTRRYLSPEELDPDLGEIGPHTDIYKLGITLYKLLTGRRKPISGTHVAHIVMNILRTEHPPPSKVLEKHMQQFKKGVEDLDELVLAMMSKNPAARPKALEVGKIFSPYRTGKQTTYSTRDLSSLSADVMNYLLPEWAINWIVNQQFGRVLLTKPKAIEDIVEQRGNVYLPDSIKLQQAGQTSFLIGSSPDCDIRIEDDSVAKRQGLLQVKNNEWSYKALGGVTKINAEIGSLVDRNISGNPVLVEAGDYFLFGRKLRRFFPSDAIGGFVKNFQDRDSERPTKVFKR